MERRKYKRFKSKLLITTVYRDEYNNIVTEDSIFTEDIGAGGLRIAFPRQLPKDNILDLKLFMFADPIPLSAKGKVVWSAKKEKLEFSTAAKPSLGEKNPKGNAKHGKLVFWVGVQFVDIDHFTQERVMRLIKKEFDSEKV